MFGDCQAHSVGLVVLYCRPSCTGNTSSVVQTPYEAVIKCQAQSLTYVRAALTFPSVPSYLSDTLYCVDFIDSVDGTKPEWAGDI
jgi:hypothetical protein